MASRYLNNITINDAYTLPSADGTNGQIITTDGSGILSFADAAASDAIVLTVKNVSGGSLSKGTVVYVSPSANPPSGNVIEVSAADNSSASTMPALAVLNATLADDAEGEAIAFGQLSGIDTSAFTVGNAIYVNTSGGFTATKPTGTALIQKLGMVVKSHASNGAIKIFGAFRSNDVPNILQDYIWLGNSSGVATPTEHLLNNVKDVTTSSPTDGQVLTWDNTNSYWKNADATGGGGDGTGTVTIEKNVYTGDGSDVTFDTTSSIVDEKNVQVYIDGVYQSKDNYSTSGSTVTFSTAPPTGVSIELIHIVAVTGQTSLDQFTGDASTTAFNLSQTIDSENNVQIYIDGVYQSKDNYTTSGKTLTFSTAPANNTAIEAVHIKAVDLSAMNSDQFTGDGSTTAFSLTNTPSSEDKTLVFIQGVYQEKSGYSISGNTLTFTTAPPNGYTIEVTVYSKITIADNTVNIERFTGNGSDTDFTLTNAPSSSNNLDVYISGLYQEKNTYTLTGSTLTLTEAPVTGAVVECRSVANITQVVAADNDFVKFDWITTPKTAAFTAVANRGYFVNTTSAAITVTLPSSPTAGDEVSIVDYAGTADTNNITITSSNNINGASDDVLIDYERGGVSMVYVDATQGWIAYNAANESAEALAPIPIIVDYLVVAGGGGGGGSDSSGEGAGGGGAGGYRTSFGDANVSGIEFAISTNYTVTVGSGGAAGTNSPRADGGNGSNSVFSTITSAGGGGGGVNAGNDGGSGGGTPYSTNAAGQGNTPSVSPSQGNNGGVGSSASRFGTSGGGGGAGQVGQTGDGGDGKQNSITGTATYYSGGGAGGNGGGAGGDGGGATALNNGTANTGGGGGGGASNQSGGAGGSGIVILRYPNTYTVTIGSGLTGSTATDGSDKVTTFTAGTGNISFS